MVSDFKPATKATVSKDKENQYFWSSSTTPDINVNIAKWRL